jgi:hypothetical protein
MVVPTHKVFVASSRVLLACGIVLLAIGALLVSGRPDDISLLQASLGWAIVCAGLLPAYFYFSREDRGAAPIVPVAGIFYAICFGLPVFLIDIGWPTGIKHRLYHTDIAQRSDLFDPNAQMLILAGVLVFSAIYILFQSLIFRRIPHIRLPQETQPYHVILLAWALMGFYLIYLFFPAVRSVPSIGQLSEPALYTAICIFFLFWQQKKIGKWHAGIVFGLMLPALMVYRMASGLMTPTLLLALLVFFLMCVVGDRRFLVIATLGAAILVLLYKPVSDYRNIVMAQSIDTITGRLSAFSESISGTIEGIGGQDVRVHQVVRRISLLPVFSFAYQRTPEPVPYWAGHTLSPLLTSAIPRLIWPDKPEERAGKAFADRYVLIQPDHRTSINIPWITEFFVNFGVSGVGMSLVGIFLAFLERLLNNRKMSPAEAAVGMAVFFPLCYPESNVSVMCGSLLPVTLCLWIYFTVGLRVAPILESRILRRGGT